MISQVGVSLKNIKIKQISNSLATARGILKTLRYPDMLYDKKERFS